MGQSAHTKDMDRLKKGIQRTGKIAPIIVVNGIVLDGNHRLKAVRDLGIDKIPIVNLNLPIEYVDPWSLEFAYPEEDL